MYIISFYSSNKLVDVACSDRDAVIAIADLLERSKNQFKVGMRGANAIPQDFGFGHYEYWLGREVQFS